jgi:hypothetical protein
MGGLPGLTAVLDDGRVLSSNALAGQRHYFRIADTRGELVRSFGPIEDAQDYGPAGNGIRDRLIAYAGGDTFWAAPPPDGRRGYELELWRTDGTLLRTVRRDVPWFPRRRQAEPPRPDSPPPPEIRVLHLDPSGLLFTVIRTNDARWRWIADSRERRARGDDIFDLRYEVIDAASGVVLASEVADSAAAVPYPWADRRRIGIQTVPDSNGLTTVRLLTYRLVPAR